MKRIIKKAAVLGSGVMGSQIACHLANAGLEVLLLDIAPKELTDEEKAKNKIVNQNLENTLKLNPSPIYKKEFAQRITTGNFDDDLHKISNCDWVIEAIIENADIKKQLFEKVEKFRKKGTLITSNTSGIPISILSKGRSDDFKKHFCGTHFFNPPRYLPLLEIIPSPDTSQEIIDFLMDYGNRFLGKTTVLCKDTPAFIANRIGVYSIMSLFHIVNEMELTIEEVDALTGPVLGRPKSATFRTVDLVGLDTLAHVAKGLKENCPNDEANNLFEIPSYIKKMIENGWLGSKTKQGFYKKIKKNGNSEILVLDIKTLKYRNKQEVKFPTLQLAKSIDNLDKRILAIFNGQDKAGEFYRKSFLGLFSYVSNRIPEISDDIYKVDDAMKAGFAWERGPFELWDIIGVENAVKLMQKNNIKVAEWINEMLSAGIKSFYKIENGVKKYYSLKTKSYQTVPGSDKYLSISTLSKEKIVWKNSGTTIYDLEDGILSIEFHTKMNTIGGEVIEGLNKAVDLAEENFQGLVIYNEGQHFSAGANVAMIFMMAIEQEFDEIDFAVRTFQNTMMRLRYSSIPVISAPHNMVLGGGCELCMHCDKVIAHTETYMGLVEMGVGLIPAGGGTKEFALRLSDELKEGDIRTNAFRNRFLTIAQAKVSTSAYEAFDLGYLRKGIDEVIISRKLQLNYAKQSALQMAEKGYIAPLKRKDIKVMGIEGLALVYSGADSMNVANFISEHDKKISEKLGYVLAGGDLSGIQTVDEQYLLNLERKTFIELCAEEKTLKRMESLIKTGKILRN